MSSGPQKFIIWYYWGKATSCWSFNMILAMSCLLGSLQFCQLGNMQSKDVFVMIWETVPHLHTVIVNASLQGDKSQSRSSQPRHTWTSGLDRAYSVSTFSFRIQSLKESRKKWRSVVHSLEERKKTEKKKPQNKRTKKSTNWKEWATLLKIDFFASISFLFLTRN